MARYLCAPWWAAVLAAAVAWCGAAAEPPEPAPPPKAEVPPPPPLSASILDNPVRPIDLAAALQLAGVQNPEILLARERVTEAVALRQLAAAQILPTLNAGTNVNVHDGTLQTSTGQIIKVNRGTMYLGLGANAVGAGTVNIPGLVWNGNVSRVLFDRLVANQVVRQREFASAAVRNDVLLAVADAYLELLRAEGRRAIALQIRDDARETARVTANFVAATEGRKADADRAAAELDQRNIDFLEAENQVLGASARLCELLDLDPSVRLHATDGWVVPAPIVPDPVPLPELLAIALTQRPELAERQAAIAAALQELRGAKLLPFSPNVLLGYSAGTFGGGSNLASDGSIIVNGKPLFQSRFDSFAPREDFDAVVYWTARNLGVGNAALVRLARSNLRAEDLRRIEVLDRIRAEVARAYAGTHARFAQIETAERAVKAAAEAFPEDLQRTRNKFGLPIELLDSLRLLARSRYAYLNAIIDYNRAQVALYVALGQPPANVLARPIPADLVPAPEPAK
jgi:outer membrane protein TolC